MGDNIGNYSGVFKGDVRSLDYGTSSVGGGGEFVSRKICGKRLLQTGYSAFAEYA